MGVRGRVERTTKGQRQRDQVLQRDDAVPSLVPLGRGGDEKYLEYPTSRVDDLSELNEDGWLGKIS